MMQATRVRRLTEASERAGIEITVAEPLGRANVDLAGEDLEVLGVAGQQWNPVNTGYGSDRKVQRSPPGLSAAPGKERMQPTALTRSGSVERQRIEVVLDGPLGKVPLGARR
jgi:hypothetical protein